jgi:NitT/TauT family transport system substrate-binding protein
MRLDPAGISLLRGSARPRAGRCVLVAASGLAVALVAACGSSSSPGGTDGQPVTIAVMRDVSDAPIYLAQKDGLFKAEGLNDVVVKTYTTSADELSAIQSGQADIASADYGSIFYREAQASNLKILADGYDATQGVLEVLALPHSALQPQDLTNQGIRVGLPNNELLPLPKGTDAPPSLEAGAATEVLETYLESAAENINWKTMPEQNEVAALADGKVQAILVGEPYIYEAESRYGAVEVMDACSASTANLPLSGYVATTAWVKDNPGAVADFRAALATAQSDASMTGVIQRVLPGAAKMTTEDADLSTIGTYPTNTSIQDLERVLNLMDFDFPAMLPANGITPSVREMIASSKT